MQKTQCKYYNADNTLQNLQSIILLVGDDSYIL